MAAATATTERLTIEIEIPSRLAAALRADAEAQGRSVASLIAESLDRRYSAEPEEPMTEAEIHEALYGPARRFDRAADRKRMQEKFGLLDLSHLTPDELDKFTEDALARLSPEKRAEAERLGLL